MPVETAVPVGASGTNQQVRNLIATVLINGVATQVMMQVVSLADQNGNLLDMNLGARMDSQLQLLADIRRELLIQSDLMAQMLSNAAPFPPPPDLEKEYRQDPYYSNPPVTL